MKAKRIFWLAVGFLGLGLGAVGAVLPVLPTVPFLMLALFSFGKSSEKLRNWFIGTKLYQKHLESFTRGQGMTPETKRKIMATVTLLMGVGFFLMLRAGLRIPCIILACVWLLHILYFTLVVKNYAPESEKPASVER